MKCLLVKWLTNSPAIIGTATHKVAVMGASIKPVDFFYLMVALNKQASLFGRLGKKDLFKYSAITQFILIHLIRQIWRNARCVQILDASWPFNVWSEVYLTIWIENSYLIQEMGQTYCNGPPLLVSFTHLCDAFLRSIDMTNVFLDTRPFGQTDLGIQGLKLGNWDDSCHKLPDNHPFKIPLRCAIHMAY